MLKIKNWVVEEKKHVRFCHDWNDKEVFTCEGLVCYAFSVSGILPDWYISYLYVDTIKKIKKIDAVMFARLLLLVWPLYHH